MRTSYTLVFLLSGILIAEVVSPAPPTKEKSPKQETNAKKSPSSTESKSKTADNAESLDDEDYETPVLTCVAFDDNTACDAMCSIMSSIYAEPVSSGTCTSGKYCECSVPPIPSLRDLWNLKFNSDSLLRQKSIGKNRDLLKKIYQVLKTPNRTPQQTKKALRSLLPESQLKNVQLRDTSLQALVSEDGSPNVEAVQRYVAEKLKSLNSPLEGRYYTRPLIQALGTSESDQETFDQIVYAVRHSKNKRLNELLTEYIQDNEVQERSLKSDDPDSLVDIVDAAIVNETVTPSVFIDFMKRKKRVNSA